jgi:hypothetical protein
MQSQTLSYVAITSLFFAAWASPARAQERDWGRAHRITGKAQEDLRQIEHHDVWAVADRGHDEAAEHNLADIRHDLDENRLDRGRLDHTIEEIEHITHVDALDGRARERLADDLRELRRLRDDWHWR